MFKNLTKQAFEIYKKKKKGIEMLFAKILHVLFFLSCLAWSMSSFTRVKSCIMLALNSKLRNIWMNGDQGCQKASILVIVN